MTEIIETPSIWDYIAHAGEVGIKSYTDAKRATEAKNAQEMGFLGELFKAGHIDSTDFNEEAKKRKLNVKVKPTPQELMRKVALSPELNPDSGKPWSDDERRMAGLPSAAAQKVEKAQASAADTQIAGDELQRQYLAGEPITEAQAAALKLPTHEELEIGRQMRGNKVLEEVGPKYLDTFLAPIMQQNGGRIPARGWQGVVDQAYQSYTEDRKKHGLAEDPSAKAYFSSHLIDRLTQQRKLDIDALQASRAGQNRMAPEDKLFMALNTTIDVRRKALNDIQDELKTNTMLANLVSLPTHQKDPDVIKFKARLAAANRAITDAQNGQADLLMGKPATDIAKKLRINTEETPPAATVNDAKVNLAVQRIKGKQATLEGWRGQIGKQITQDEYNAIAAAVSKK